MITSSNNIKVIIKNTLAMDNTCFYGLKNQQTSKFISTKTKINLYKPLIRLMVLYGSECYVLNKTEEGLLLIFEKDFWPVKENNIWRIIYNHEIYQIFSKLKHHQVGKGFSY